MDIAQDSLDLKANLTDLREETFSFVLALAGAISLIWFMVGQLTLPFYSYSSFFWLGLVLLILSVGLSYWLKARHLQAALYVLVWGILGTVISLLVAFPVPVTACLFILPILFASALLKEKSFFQIATVAGLITVIIGYAYTPPVTPVSDTLLVMTVATIRRLLSSGVLLPLSIITITTISAWGTSRSLHTALAWVWHGYQQAGENERAAHENQAELRRVLKSLDNAFYLLERSNYKLMLARNQAEEARRLKQQFAQTISHELRTPLNLIVSFTELMTQSPEYYGGPPPFPYMRDLTIVYRNAGYLQALVNDVLDLARIEAAQMTILPAETDPAHLVLEAVNTARSLVESVGLDLHTYLDPDLPSLWIDPTRIRQVLFNLINNAARFTEQGSVTVRVSRQDDELVFSVADTGVGIAPHDLSRVFEEFRQLDGGTQRQREGAGLGLVISKRFVELHGGHIWVESKVGEGSTFYFSLPISRTETDTMLDISAETMGLISKVDTEEPILLAVTRSSLAIALLTRHVQGGHTIVVQTLEQAGQTVHQLMPQAIVIDSTCEGLDLQNLDALAREWDLRQTPIMVCPLPGEEPLRQRLAVDGYLFKPVSQRSLWDLMRQFSEDMNRVLIIDDDQDFVLLLSRLLEDNPVRRYQVFSAGTGEEGLRMIKQRLPDLVLLDMALPDMNGLEFIKRARSTLHRHNMPIIVVSEQEEFRDYEPKVGAMTVTKASGLRPGEVIQWVQNIFDATIQSQVSPEKNT